MRLKLFIEKQEIGSQITMSLKTVYPKHDKGFTKDKHNWSMILLRPWSVFAMIPIHKWTYQPFIYLLGNTSINNESSS